MEGKNKDGIFWVWVPTFILIIVGLRSMEADIEHYAASALLFILPYVAMNIKTLSFKLNLYKKALIK